MAASNLSEWDAIFVADVAVINRLIAQAVQTGTISLPVLNWSSGQSSVKGRITEFQLAENSDLTGTKVPVVIKIVDFVSTSLIRTVHADTITVALEMELQHFDNPDQVTITLMPSPAIDNLSIDPKVIDGVQSSSLTMPVGKALNQVLQDFKPALGMLDRVLPAGLTPKLVGHTYEGVPFTEDNGIIGDDTPKVEAATRSALAIMYMTTAIIPGNPPPAPDPGSSVVSMASDGAALRLSGNLFSNLLLLPAIAQAFFGGPNAPLSEAQLADIRSKRLDVPATGAGIVSHPGAPSIHFRSTEVDLSLMYSLVGTGIAFPIALLPLIGISAVGALGEMITHKGNPALMAPTEIYLDRLSFLMVAEQLDATIDVRAVVSLAGIELATITMTLTTSFKMTIGGDGKIGFKQVGTTSHTDPKVSTPSWLGTSNTVINVFLSIVGVIAAIVTDGVAAILVGAMIGVLQAVLTSIVPMAFEHAAKSGTLSVVPSSTVAGVEGVRTSLTFLTGARFAAETVSLDQGFILGGRLVVPTPQAPPPHLIARASSRGGE
jgi:hypothetical protein